MGLRLGSGSSSSGSSGGGLSSDVGGLSRSYELANDSEMRLLLAYSSPPRAGRVTAVNSGLYTVEIADGDNATLEAVALNGFAYALDDVVYVLQAANAPDCGVIVGRKGYATQLGIGAGSPDGSLHVEDANGGFAVVSAGGINGTEQTMLTARIGQALTGDALAADGVNYNTATLNLAVPGSSYTAQSVNVGGTTVQFRVYANGDLRVVRTAGTGTPSAVVRALWV